MTYTVDDWRGMDIEQLLAQAHDTAKLAQRHYAADDVAAADATLDALLDQVHVLHDRRDELAARVAERVAAAAEQQAETAVSPPVTLTAPPLDPEPVEPPAG